MADRRFGRQTLLRGTPQPMNRAVQHSRLFSICYMHIGIAPTRNLSEIIMLQFPECPQLGAQWNCWPTLYKEFTTR